MSDWFAGNRISGRPVDFGSNFSAAICRKSTSKTCHEHEGIARCGNLTVVGDIELYNSSEIVNRLGRDAVLVASDRNISIAAAYLSRLGIESISDFNGDFALAILDDDNRQLTLACDHMGSRSLYWIRHSGVLFFGSTPAVLRSLLPDPPGPELRSLIWHAVNVSPGADRSYLQAIKRVTAGRRLSFDPSSDGNSVRYWRPSARPASENTFEDAVALIEQEVIRAVTSRIPSTGSTGIALSGGLDSTLIANIAAQSHKERMFHAITGTRSSGDPDVRDEEQFARTVSQRHDNIALHLAPGGDGALFAGMNHAPKVQASPLRQILFFQKDSIYQCASKVGAETVLSGNGGDDAISVWGFSAYRELLSKGRIAEAWLEAKNRFGSNAAAAWMIVRAMVGFTGLNRRLFSRRLVARRAFGSLPLQDGLLADPQIADELFDSHVVPPNSVNDINSEIVHNLQVSALTGQNDIDLELPYLYRLDVRNPLLDWQLLECILALDLACFAHDGVNRRLMRELVRRSGSVDISLRRDKGVFAPDIVETVSAQEHDFGKLFSVAASHPLWRKIYNSEALRRPLPRDVTWDRFDDLINRRVIPAQIAYFLVEN